MMRIRLFAVPALTALAIGLSAQANPKLSFLLETGGLTSRLASFGSEQQTDIIEFKDGDDPITHKRAGRASHAMVTLGREWVGESPAFDAILNSLLSAKPFREDFSVAYLNKSDEQENLERLEAVGDTVLFIPSAGSFRQSGESKPIQIKAACRGTQNIVHRDIAARGAPKPLDLATLRDVATNRMIECTGFSGIEIKVVPVDVDGDLLPDVIRSIDSSNFTWTMDVSERPFMAEWKRATAEAAAKGVPYSRQLALAYYTGDGWVLEFTFNATLITHTANGFQSEDAGTAATETVVFRPHRGAVK